MGIIGVLLAILKVIGLVLLGLLGLLLLILILFLFVPFVYKIRVKYVGKRLEADGEVSFLFRILRAGFAYKEELSYDAKAAFFTLVSSEKASEDKEDNKAEYKSLKAADGEAEDKNLKATDCKVEDTSLKTKEAKEGEGVTSTGIIELETVKAEAGTKIEPKIEPKTKVEPETQEAKSTTVEREMETAVDSKQINSRQESNKQEDSKIEDDTQVDCKQEVCGQVNEENKTDKKQKSKKNKKEKSKKTKKKKLSIFVKIEEVKGKAKKKWEAFKETFFSLNNKKDAVLRFINAEGTAEGIFYLLIQSKILLKMMLPKKINGWLRFGTGDVYTEGQYLTYLCFLYPLYAGKFEIIPEWDEEVIEVDASFSGKIRMFAILVIGLKLLFSKKVKALLRNFNKCKKSFAKG